MRIIFLNIWEAKMIDQVSSFIESHKDDTDIFCLQEVHGDSIRIIRELLPDFSDSFIEIYKTADEEYAQATFIKKNFKCKAQETLLLDDIDKGLVLYTEIDLGDKSLYLCNVHGVARVADGDPKDHNKGDTPARLSQSQKVIDFMKDKEGLKVIGGDFNFSPHIQSYDIFLKQGYDELIKDFNIKTTRNHFVWDRYPDNPLYYSDYVFVSKEVPVKNLSVLDVEISDHLPIILDF